MSQGLYPYTLQYKYLNGLAVYCILDFFRAVTNTATHNQSQLVVVSKPRTFMGVGQSA